MSKSTEFGKRLRELRLKRKKTRRDISFALEQKGSGVTERTISSWENGTTLPDVMQILNLSTILKINTGYFFVH